MKMEMVKAITEHLEREIHAQHTYIVAAVGMRRKGLLGYAAHLAKQAEGEWDHAQRFLKYLEDQDAPVAIPSVRKALDNPDATVAQIAAVVLDIEQVVTRSINELMDMAIDLGDYATQDMLQWFIDEQVEEERTALDNLNRAKLAEAEKSVLVFDASFK